jgi:hypothetical protein
MLPQVTQNKLLTLCWWTVVMLPVSDAAMASLSISHVCLDSYFALFCCSAVRQCAASSLAVRPQLACGFLRTVKCSRRSMGSVLFTSYGHVLRWTKLKATYYSRNNFSEICLFNFIMRAMIAQSVKRWATGWTIGVLGFDSLRGLGIFLFTTASRTALGPTQPPIQWVPGALSQGLKRPGREADHSPPSTAEVKESVELYLHSPSTPSWRGA